jgi:hypothetical protein
MAPRENAATTLQNLKPAVKTRPHHGVADLAKTTNQ